MLHCHGAEVGDYTQVFICEGKPGGGGALGAWKRGDSETAAHAKVDVHDHRVSPSTKEVEQVFAVDFNSLEDLAVYQPCTCEKVEFV